MLKGVKAALTSPDTPKHLLPALERWRERLEMRIARDRKKLRREKTPLEKLLGL
jgi:hypothetical protein